MSGLLGLRKVLIEVFSLIDVSSDNVMMLLVVLIVFSHGLSVMVDF